MPRSHYNPKDSLSVKSDYYKHIYSQRDVDLIRGDLMARIAELTDAIDAFNHIDRSGRRDIVDLEQLNYAVEKCLILINGDC